MVAKLVIEYQQSCSNDCFEAIHDSVSDILARRASGDARRTGQDIDEIESLHLHCLLRAVTKFPNDGRAFEPYLQQTITNACRTLAKKERRKRCKELPLLDYEDYDKQDMSYQHKTKASEQLRLLNSLLVDVDEIVIKIVSESPNYENNGDPNNLFNYAALGRAAGISGTNPGQDVKRKLRRLAVNFDSSEFGDWKNYLSA